MEARAAALKVKEVLDLLKIKLGFPVFDEWVVLQIMDGQWKILMYQSPRKEEFKANFKEDVSSLKPLDPTLTQIGEFGFSRTGHGTNFDAFMHAGENIFFLFNHTVKSAHEVMDDPSWELAQSEFEKLEEMFIIDPVESV